MEVQILRKSQLIQVQQTYNKDLQHLQYIIKKTSSMKPLGTVNARYINSQQQSSANPNNNQIHQQGSLVNGDNSKSHTFKLPKLSFNLYNQKSATQSNPVKLSHHQQIDTERIENKSVVHQRQSSSIHNNSQNDQTKKKSNIFASSSQQHEMPTNNVQQFGQSSNQLPIHVVTRHIPIFKRRVLQTPIVLVQSIVNKSIPEVPIVPVTPQNNYPNQQYSNNYDRGDHVNYGMQQNYNRGESVNYNTEVHETNNQTERINYNGQFNVNSNEENHRNMQESQIQNYAYPTQPFIQNTDNVGSKSASQHSQQAQQSPRNSQHHQYQQAGYIVNVRPQNSSHQSERSMKQQNQLESQQPVLQQQQYNSFGQQPVYAHNGVEPPQQNFSQPVITQQVDSKQYSEADQKKIESPQYQEQQSYRNSNDHSNNFQNNNFNRETVEFHPETANKQEYSAKFQGENSILQNNEIPHKSQANQYQHMNASGSINNQVQRKINVEMENDYYSSGIHNESNHSIQNNNFYDEQT